MLFNVSVSIRGGDVFKVTGDYTKLVRLLVRAKKSNKVLSFKAEYPSGAPYLVWNSRRTHTQASVAMVPQSAACTAELEDTGKELDGRPVMYCRKGGNGYRPARFYAGDHELTPDEVKALFSEKEEEKHTHVCTNKSVVRWGRLQPVFFNEVEECYFYMRGSRQVKVKEDELLVTGNQVNEY